MPNDAIIQINNLSAKYSDDVILDNITFDVYQNEIFVVLGGSGCGKSTLLRHTIGLEVPFAGNVTIDGADLINCSETEFKNTLKKIGVLFQGSALFGSMTVSENVALPIQEYSNLKNDLIDKIVNLKLGLVGLEGYGNHLPSEISGGMKKRAGLARALALNPKILFLDEPSAGLDPITSKEIDELILDINKNLGTTIVIVTHELESIFTVAQRVIMLDKTKKGIIAEGKPADLKKYSTNQTVKDFFNRKSNKK
ncbi:MAG: ATP-binding cassette domain-containing protein [Deltaproteobacteria bacterium]|nr:ATP-binding cassette domain-containing protein [Deltaproteobacteria bacterium]MBW1845907.1 ATP-binding cassette domain-containing protein [Deltaproteobacteria bacterium]MBW2179463.1 ATP-binding cassette domain-containing protein [Deltaproteobacteria bacterium]MBW2363543.1 ATP-binding cassette domain-containing protein [Deltaproteobacteria bacterium]